jgi:hypothetical protein
MSEKITMAYEGKVVTIILPDFENASFDMDAITNIDYSNIEGEILTFSTVLNRIGILCSEIEKAYNEKKFETKVLESSLYEKYRKSLISKDDKDKIKYPSEGQIEAAINNDIEYQKAVKAELKAKRQHSDMNSLYWSAKSKDSKLDTFCKKIVPEEFEKNIVEGTINGILIKVKKTTLT